MYKFNISSTSLMVYKGRVIYYQVGGRVLSEETGNILMTYWRVKINSSRGVIYFVRYLRGQMCSICLCLWGPPPCPSLIHQSFWFCIDSAHSTEDGCNGSQVPTAFCSLNSLIAPLICSLLNQRCLSTIHENTFYHSQLIHTNFIINYNCIMGCIN